MSMHKAGILTRLKFHCGALNFLRNLKWQSSGLNVGGYLGTMKRLFFSCFSLET